MEAMIVTQYRHGPGVGLASPQEFGEPLAEVRMGGKKSCTLVDWADTLDKILTGHGLVVTFRAHFWGRDLRASCYPTRAGTGQANAVGEYGAKWHFSMMQQAPVGPAAKARVQSEYLVKGHRVLHSKNLCPREVSLHKVAHLDIGSPVEELAILKAWPNFCRS